MNNQKCEVFFESGDMQTRSNCDNPALYNVLPNDPRKAGCFVCEQHLPFALQCYDDKCYAFNIETRQMVYPPIEKKPNE